jgi:hypothetical protein
LPSPGLSLSPLSPLFLLLSLTKGERDNKWGGKITVGGGGIVIVLEVDVRLRMKRRGIYMRALMWPRCVCVRREREREKETRKRE